MSGQILGTTSDYLCITCPRSVHIYRASLKLKAVTSMDWSHGPLGEKYPNRVAWEPGRQNIARRLGSAPGKAVDQLG